MYALSELIQQDDQPDREAVFPDLFSRLKAQIGYSSARSIWNSACSWLNELSPMVHYR